MITLKIALLINLIIIICELYTLGHIKRKADVLKYYTYLQNLLALIASVVFFVYTIVSMVSGGEIPSFVRGLRYVASCGLAATMLIFLTVLGRGRKIAITEEDFLPGCAHKTANAVLHYICPVLSLVGFAVFEREVPLTNGIWTTLAAIPSCLYWIVYSILSAAKLWEEPYAFAAQEGKSKVQEILLFFLLPLLFVAISFVLWVIK